MSEGRGDHTRGHRVWVRGQGVEAGAGALQQPASNSGGLRAFLHPLPGLAIRGAPPGLGGGWLGLVRTDCPPRGFTRILIGNLDKPLVQRQVVANRILK